MKVLFAVNDEKDAEAITRVYQKEYKEIISSKTVYYFNAIIKELQKDKTYDRIVISEDLEMFSSDNYQAVDKFIFEKMDAISDEATNNEGNDIPIILLCMDRRTKNDPLLVKLFGLGLYNVLIGQDRSIQKVAGLMYKPRTKKEAKAYYKVEAENVGYSTEDKNGGVNETEIQNILNHYKKIGDNVPKCVQSFESIMSQYSKDQVKLIAEVLPKNTKVILEENSDSYRKLMGIKGNKAVGTSELRKTEYVEKEIDSGNRLTQPVIIPTAVNTKQVNKVLSAEELKKKKLEEARKKAQEKLAKEKAEAKKKAEEEARRKEKERIAREKAEEEARRKEEERIAREKAEKEARRKEEERLAREKAEEEARRKEEERIAREKAEEDARRKAEEERIAKEKEEKAKQEAKERLEKERAEAKARIEAKKKAEEEKKIKEAEEIKRKEQEKMAEEKLKVENDEPVVKRGRGRPRKNPVVPVVLEDVPVKRKRGRPRKNPIEESVENVEKTIEDVVEEKTEKISKPDIKEDIKEIVDSKKNNSVEDDDLFDFIDFEDTANQDLSNEKQSENEIDEVDLDLYDDFDDFDDFEDESNNVNKDEEDSYYDDEDDEFDEEDEEFDYDSVYGQDNELSEQEEELSEKDTEDNNEDSEDEDTDFLPGFDDDDDLEDYDDYDFDDEIDDIADKDVAEEENVEEISDNNDDDEFEDYDDEDFDFDDYEDEDLSDEDLPDEDVSNNNESEEDDDFLPGFDDEEDYNIEDADEIEDIDENVDENVDEDVDEDDEFLPGFDDEADDYEEDDDYDFVDDVENVEPESIEDDELNNIDEIDETDDAEDDEPLPGFEEEDSEEDDEVDSEVDDEVDSEEDVSEIESDNDDIQYNGAFKGINNRNYKYDNDLANSIKDLKQSEDTTSSYNIDTDNLITSDQKVVSFVGTSKNGTSFIVNNLAEMYSNQGIQTAILDLTKNKNAYYVYTNNEDELREKAHDCFEKLTTGIADGIQVNKNLTVYTSLPGEDDSLDEVTNIIKTLLENYTIVLLDCDFETDARYFKIAQELYLVQSWDVLTIQPLTAFLRDLKVKNILETNKLRIIINKDVKIGSISEKALIGGMSSYSDPAMTYMTELFNRDTIKYVTIPFDNQVYAKYLEGIANCKISTKGYSKSFISSMNRLSDMVYPTISGKKSKKQYNDFTSQNKQFEDTFSKDTSSILDKMKKKY